MKLYYLKTMNSRKPCATAKHLGLPVEYVPLQPDGLKAPDYLALNPNGKAPSLVDGDLKLWESAAIAAHVAVRAGSDMWPANDPGEQIEVMRWISWDACEWAPAVGQFYFERIIKPMIGMGEPDQALLDKTLPTFHELAEILDAHLASRSYLACARLTIADFCVAAMLPEWQAERLPLPDYPNVMAWHERLMALPAWSDPWPSETQA